MLIIIWKNHIREFVFVRKSSGASFESRMEDTREKKIYRKCTALLFVLCVLVSFPNLSSAIYFSEHSDSCSIYSILVLIVSIVII